MASLPAQGTKSLRAAIYCRVSTKRQEDNYSLDSQEASGREYAAEHGFCVDPQHIYMDTHSGADLFERPQLNAMREAIRAKTIDVVVCHTIDRLSRDPVHLGFLISEADGKGVAIAFVKEPYDNSPEGQLIQYVRGHAAQIERMKIKERSIHNKRERSKNGALLPASYPAFGYRWRPHIEGQKPRTAYDIDHTKAPIVRRIFAMIAAGGTLRGIRATFEKEGTLSPTGMPAWPITTLKVIVENPMYKGEAEAWRHKAVKNEKGRTSMVLRDESERIKLPPGVVPPIVSPELWQRANDQLDRNRQLSARHHRSPGTFLLRGFVVCPHCGRTIGTITKLGRYRASPTYIKAHGCPYTSISAERLDQEVWEFVERIITHPDRIIDEITKNFQQDEPTKADREAIERRIAEVRRAERKQALIIEALDDIELSSEPLARLKMLAKERLALEKELAQLEQRYERWASGLRAAEKLLEMFHAEQARLGSLSYAEKRAILTWLGVSVCIHPQYHEPRWTITTRIALPDMVEPVPNDGSDDEPVPGGEYRTGVVFPDDESFPAMVQ